MCHVYSLSVPGGEGQGQLSGHTPSPSPEAWRVPFPQAFILTSEETVSLILFKVLTQMNSQIHQPFVQETEHLTFRLS